MAVVSITDLYGYFETGDKPTQAQFKNLIDTLSDNSGVVVLGANVRTFEAPQDAFIDDIVILSSEPYEQVVSCIVEQNGVYLVKNELLLEYLGVYPVKHYCTMAETIVFTGLNENSIIKIYIK